MKNRKLKQRVLAFGLAMLMGVSTFGSMPALAAEDTEIPVAETESGVQAVSERIAVTAEDITKEAGDPEFFVETCMEGIQYDPEQEEVTLTGIEGEDGSDYDSNRSGTYIASYLVVPKDQSESYVITRNVTLTDTEGQAHDEANGGEKQKEDTASEEDSESETSEQPEVEITSSEEAVTEEALQELEEDIESGNVMIFSGSDVTRTARSTTVSLNKGETIYYPSYIGSYVTSRFTVNGKIAYCLQSNLASPPTGDYVAQVGFQ